MKQLRVLFQEIQDDCILARTSDGEGVVVTCSEEQREELICMAGYLRKGMMFNLLNVEKQDDGILECEFWVLEPDYLVDISSLAECFRPYGHHPLNYVQSRMSPMDNTQYILLGNTANFFIDSVVNEDPLNPVEYKDVIRQVFKNSPFEFSACDDLREPTVESRFFASCKQHFNHIRKLVEQAFPKAGMDREKILLEPSFICNALGLQGRLDLMLHDFSGFVELKSGKAVEDFRTGGAFIHSAINHYTQMMLYLSVLEFNLGLDPESVRSYLLYSKYPVLSKEKHSRRQLIEAIRLRNAIVVLDCYVQQQNSVEAARALLGNLRSEVLNTARMEGKFFENYLRPSIDRFRLSFAGLDEIEQTYFLRLYSFITKELWLSKIGEREYEGVKKAANLWNASFEDKLSAGEILYDLKMLENRAAEEEHTVSLQIPVYENMYLPNFRSGDAVVLYVRNRAEDTVNNRQVFKGSIESLDPERVTVRLRYRQKNRSVWPETALYAIEHDYMDSTTTGMYRALVAFVNANQERRDLLLARRQPLTDLDPNQPLPEDDVARALRKVHEMRDCFLLVGPPGTGKTSLAMKQMVEDALKEDHKNILLLSYTNRAVDEMCRALHSISDRLSFIRIGSELNCAPEYRMHLMDNCLESCNRRSEVQEVIARCRIFVGTVASVWNRPELFRLKSFDLAIVDEATQLLEPHLLGILCAKTAKGENAVRRFVLIGDHKQLPAVVLQSKEESRVNEPALQTIGLTDLSNSLFERLYRSYREEGFVSVYDLLSRQGRMHPKISAFPSHSFYNGKLDCVGLPHQLDNGKANRLRFFPIERCDSSLPDKINPEEARMVVRICNEIYRKQGKNFQPSSIGIITPYRNQIALIRNLIKETGIDVLASIVVDTIERFQGSQRDIIIYSFCVNSEGQLSVLPNLMEEDGVWIDRKLNVVLTRAREHLFIIGNRNLLSKNPIFKSMIEHIEGCEVN